MLDEVDRMIGVLRSKSGTWIKSAADRKQLEEVVVGWKTLESTVNLAREAREGLEKDIEGIAAELAKPHPIRKTVLESLVNFRLLFYSNIHLPDRTKRVTFVTSQIENELAQLEAVLTNDLEKDYFREARMCQAIGANRSFVVVFWSIVIHRLYKLIEAKGLQPFSAAYSAKYGPKRSPSLAKIEDLFEISDKQLVDNLYDPLSWIDKHQWEVLDVQRKMRNRCAHVSTRYKPDDANVLNFTSELARTILLHIA